MATEDRLSAQARQDQDLAALRDDVDLLTYRIVRLEIENRALKLMVSMAFLLALIIPLAVYFAVV